MEDNKSLINVEVSNQLANLLDFHPKDLNENNLIRQLSEHISYLLEHNPDAFFSKMYVLDVNEKQVQQILLNFENAEEQPSIALAKLVFNRALQRAKAKLNSTKTAFGTPDWAD